MNKAIYLEDHKILVEKLKQARIEAGFDQISVAKLLGKSQSYVSKIESGQRRIDIHQLRDFAKIYKKSIDFLVK
jgi:transcriptional regulator with XRE-family HTH domain